MDTHHERRQDPRCEARLQAWVWCGEVTLDASVLNVSRGGLYVKAPAKLARGSEVSVDLRLGEKLGSLHARAVVAWTGGPVEMEPECDCKSMGLRFTNVSTGESQLHALLADVGC